jgi:hypothetical protein
MPFDQSASNWPANLFSAANLSIAKSRGAPVKKSRSFLLSLTPVELSATRLVKLSKDLPHDWRAQRQVLGFSAA